jgi:hypothetical protein
MIWDLSDLKVLMRNDCPLLATRTCQPFDTRHILPMTVLNESHARLQAHRLAPVQSRRLESWSGLDALLKTFSAIAHGHHSVVCVI